MTIDNLPDPPQTSDPADFNPAADAFLVALQKLVGQVNAALGLVTSINQSRIVDVVDDTGLTLATAYANGQTVDGQVLTTGMRILRAVPGGDATNGVYDAPAAGAASRSIDCNSSALFPSGLLIAVTRGTTYAKEIFLHTTAPGFALGVTALTFRIPTRKPKFVQLLSGTTLDSATYPFAKRFKAKLRAGGGGGGGGSSTNGGASSTAGGAGGNTSLNGIVANGGGGGSASTNTGTTGGNGGIGGNGGTGSTGVIRRNKGLDGFAGGASNTANVSVQTMPGGGQGGWGSGGLSGSFGGTTGASAGSGAQGEGVEMVIENPTGTYSMAIGAAGSGGATNGGSGTAAGGNGVQGEIQLEVHY